MNRNLHVVLIGLALFSLHCGKPSTGTQGKTYGVEGDPDLQQFRKTMALSQSWVSSSDLPVTCVIVQGKVKCWGDNTEGQLGQGLSTSPLLATNTSTNIYPFQSVQELPFVDLGWQENVVDITVGYAHVCALAEHGKVKCWGSQDLGQLGVAYSDSYIGDQATEMGFNLLSVDLGGLKAIQISAGFYHTCALLEDHRIKCWGANDFGQLGTEDQNSYGTSPFPTGSNQPFTNVGSGKVIKVSAGGESTCVLFEAGDVKCWGINDFGKLGIGGVLGGYVGGQVGDMGNNLPAIDVGGEKVIDVEVGSFVSCVILESGKSKCWGRNSVGQLGMDSLGDQGSGVGDIAAMSGINVGGEKIASASPSGYHSCVVLASGNVTCFGGPGAGKLGYENNDFVGNGSGTSVANAGYVALGLISGEKVIEMASSYAHNCIKTNMDRIKCWGYNNVGQLGYGDFSQRGDAPGSMGLNLGVVEIE
ncbi:MAG: hypothetical protein R3A11_00535 [Bdellovibrionota bacterium]